MTYDSDLVMFKGVYGWVHTVSLKNYTDGVLRARKAYAERPFERSYDNNDKAWEPRRLWSKKDVAYLKKKRREGVEYAVIAAHLDRSVSATQRKAFDLGLVNKRS